MVVLSVSLFSLVSRKFPPRKISPCLGLVFGLELGLRSGLGGGPTVLVGNYPRTVFVTFKCHKSEWYLEALRLDLKKSIWINKTFLKSIFFKKMCIFHYNICFIIIFHILHSDRANTISYAWIFRKKKVVLVFKGRDFIILPWYVSSLLPEISFSQKI